MSHTNRSGQGDFPSTPKDALRHGLGQIDNTSWSGLLRDGLNSAWPVFNAPELAPEFYGKLGDKSLALALAGSVYSQTEIRQAQRPAEAENATRLKALGFNILAAAMTASPEIEETLRDVDPYEFEKGLPEALELTSQPVEVRDQVWKSLHGDLPLRGMFIGLSGIWEAAIEATREPKKLTGKSGIRLGNHSLADQQDRERGLLIAEGYNTLLAVTAAYLGYDIRPAADPTENTNSERHEVVQFRSLSQETEGPAIPPELHTFVQEGMPIKLGINIPEGRIAATSNSVPALEALKRNASVVDGIREAVIKRVGAYTGFKMAPESIADGSNTIALALAQATSARFTEVWQSLDLLEREGLRDSERLARCATRACERAEAAAERIATHNLDLRPGSASLKSQMLIPDPEYPPDPKHPEDPVRTIYATPLLAGLCRAVNNDERNYAHREKQMHTERFNGYIAGAYAFIETIYELLTTIPLPQETKRVA